MTHQAVTANRLTDGQVVYLTKAGAWSERIDECHIADGKELADALLQIAERAVAQRQVVDPYLFALIEEDGQIRPHGQRETIRARGPSVRPDLSSHAGTE